MFLSNQDDRGAQININGAGITASARNVDAPLRLLEFVTAT